MATAASGCPAANSTLDIARASGDPDLLILDEATSQLKPSPSIQSSG
jgi:hypothetical protein